MVKRFISDKQRAWLLDELNSWRDQAILSQEQVFRILDLYETSAESAQRRQSRAVFTLTAIAAFLVGLAGLLAIGHNWEAMPRVLKLVTILGVITATHAGGFYLRYRRNARALSEAVFFLGCLFYGAGIWLVAQVFHLNAHYPDGVWWWAVGVLPFALCLDTLLLHALFVGLLGLWAYLEVLGFPHLGVWLFGRWGFIARDRQQPSVCTRHSWPGGLFCKRMRGGGKPIRSSSSAASVPCFSSLPRVIGCAAFSLLPIAYTVCC